MAKITLALFLFLFTFTASSEGLTLGATRLIYAGNSKEASIPVMTSGDAGPFLIQSWVSNMDKSTNNIPFVTTPPIFKIGKNEQNTVRVVNVDSNLPKDKESVFLLNIRAIPAVKKENTPERLIVATQNIIKLIYRPATLNSKDAAEAIDKLEINSKGNNIIIRNPTPYAVTIANMNINKDVITRPGVAMPFSELVIPTKNPQKNSTVSFSIINDFGGLSLERKIIL